jgi:DNA-binding response OmpR family regulator
MGSLTVDLKELRACVDAGLTTGEICRLLSMSEGWFRKLAKKHGLTVRKQYKLTYADRAARLPPKRAVEYLMGVVQALEERLQEYEKARKELPFYLSPQRTKLLNYLIDQHPKPASLKGMYDVMCWDKADSEKPDEKVVTVLVHHLRPILKRHGFGEIKNIWGYGYKFVPGPKYNEWAQTDEKEDA